jgi:Protein kinase C terminal domain
MLCSNMCLLTSCTLYYHLNLYAECGLFRACRATDKYTAALHRHLIHCVVCCLHIHLVVQVKRHPFFTGIDWDRMMLREMMPPWEPTVVGSLDTSQFDREFTSMPIFSPSDEGILYLYMHMS